MGDLVKIVYKSFSFDQQPPSMSQSKFTSANAANLEPVGRTSNGGKKTPLALRISDGVLTIANADGFVLTVRLDDVVAHHVGRAGLQHHLHTTHVDCVLHDGTVLPLAGNIRMAGGTLRLDAIDQEGFSWFWVEVRPNWRSLFRRSV